LAELFQLQAIKLPCFTL